MNPLRTDSSSPREYTALLCLDAQELLDTASSQLTPPGSEAHTASTPEQALSQLYSHSYDVLVLSEHFGGGDAQAHPVLSQLAALPLNMRRKLYVILVGPSLTPCSQAQAFALSVDLVLRPQDLSNLKAFVGQGLRAHEEFYSAFNAVDRLLQKDG